MTTSDWTPTFLCLQAGRKIIPRPEVHVFERMTQVASTGSESHKVRESRRMLELTSYAFRILK